MASEPERQTIRYSRPKKKRGGKTLKYAAMQMPLATADVMASREALRSNPNAVEGNPLMRGSLGKQFAIKAGTALAIGALANEAEKRGHSNVAKVINGTGMLVNGALALRALKAAQ